MEINEEFDNSCNTARKIMCFPLCFYLVFVFTGTGLPAGTKKLAIHYAANAMMIEMGISVSFLKTHNGTGGLRTLPALEPGYVAPPIAAPPPVENGHISNGSASGSPDNPALNNGPGTSSSNSSNSIAQLRELCEELEMNMPEFEVSQQLTWYYT